MADAFRLLSRSTTVSRPRKQQDTKPAVQSKPATASAAAAVPNAATKPSKKRKRKAGSNGANTTATVSSLPKELDFFGLNDGLNTAENKKRKRGVDGDADNDSEDSDSGSDEVKTSEEQPESQSDDDEDPLPTEAEIKSILRQHRLKFTLLSPTPVAEPPPKKKKKKSSTEKPKKLKKEEILVAPLTSFSQLCSERHGYALSPRVYANVLAQGYEAPTEVQMGALPVLMKHNLKLPGHENSMPVDLLTCAPTGSGKTLAYVVPLLDGLLRQRKEKGKKKGVKAVVLAPTKELVGQIVNEVKKLALGTGVRVTQFKKGQLPISVVDEELGVSTEDESQAGSKRKDERTEHSGPEAEDSGSEGSGSESEGDSDEEEPNGKANQKRNRSKSAIKADIIVCTPLTLLHAIESAKSICMRGISHLVFDEADVLLDPLFLEQTQPLWNHLRKHSPLLSSTLWSATISSSTESLVKSTLADRTILRLIVGIKDTSLPSISQSLVYCATESGKLHALRTLFATALKPPILIFVQSIPRAQALFSELLYDLPSPGRIAVLHSALTDTVRSETMARFRRGEVWVLITTDLIARGMDFRGVRQVVNYDIPTSTAAYIHRIGRTGRSGKEGEAFTYYTKADVRYVSGFAHVIDASRKEGEEPVAKWLLEALPKAGKREKQKLKKHGVEERRGKGKEGRITTVPGWERQERARKKGAIEKSKRDKAGAEAKGAKVSEAGAESEFEGFE